MKKWYCLSLALVWGIFAAAPVVAQNDPSIPSEGVQSFQQDKDSWRRGSEKEKQVLQPIVDSIGQAAWGNIKDAELVFCYEVSSRPNNYDGYTLNGFTVTGFCGVLPPAQRDNFIDTFMKSPENVLLNQSENCVIRPRIMLRFVRGVDAVDILLSSPCYSYSVFYGGKVKTFNAKPAAEQLDRLIIPLSQRKQNFVSPALLKQLLPIGVAQTQEQKDLVNKKNKPIRGWEDGKTPAEQPEKKGGAWGNLNLKI